MLSVAGRRAPIKLRDLAAWPFIHLSRTSSVRQYLDAAFRPQAMPDDYVRATALPLLLRPREFLANAWDMSTLKAAVVAQMPRYAEIKVPVIILHGDVDKAVYLTTHSQNFVKAVPHAELIVLPGVGHLVQNAATERVVAAIEQLMPQAAARAEASAVR